MRQVVVLFLQLSLSSCVVRKACRNIVISHVLAINLPLQLVLDKKVSGGPPL